MTKQMTLRILAASALAATLAGCGHRSDDGRVVGFTERPQTFEQRHPIEVEKAQAHLTLQTPANAHGLNTYQKEKLRHFIAIWRNEGYGKLSVAGNNKDALGGVRDILIERVVPVGAVQVGSYGLGQSGVKISFARYVAEGPVCGNWTKNLADQQDNQNYANFGCAAQHNMAAMIANPKDLQVPRDQGDWQDADRNDFVWRYYRSGAETGALIAPVKDAGSVSAVK